LTEALSARDLVAASALRSALSAIANAEAIAPAETGSNRPSSEHFAGAAAGLGAAEAARRELTETDIAEIVSAEINDRRSAADDYDRLDRPDQAARLRREADVLADLLTVR
jgi:uncharacterized protein YqeY